MKATRRSCAVAVVSGAAVIGGLALSASPSVASSARISVPVTYGSDRVVDGGVPSSAAHSSHLIASGHSAGVVPLDHQGCSEQVCIDVKSQNGHGTYVTYIEGFSRNILPSAHPSTTYLYGGMSNKISQMKVIGVINNGVATQWFDDFDTNYPKSYPNGYWLCVANTNGTYWPGFPCAQILS